MCLGEKGMCCLKVHSWSTNTFWTGHLNVANARMTSKVGPKKPIMQKTPPLRSSNCVLLLLKISAENLHLKSFTVDKEILSCGNKATRLVSLVEFAIFLTAMGHRDIAMLVLRNKNKLHTELFHLFLRHLPHTMDDESSYTFIGRMICSWRMSIIMGSSPLARKSLSDWWIVAADVQSTSYPYTYHTLNQRDILRMINKKYNHSHRFWKTRMNWSTDWIHKTVVSHLK